MIVLGLTEIGDRSKAEKAVAEIAGTAGQVRPPRGAARLTEAPSWQGQSDDIRHVRAFSVHDALNHPARRWTRLSHTGITHAG